MHARPIARWGGTARTCSIVVTFRRRSCQSKKKEGASAFSVEHTRRWSAREADEAERGKTHPRVVDQQRAHGPDDEDGDHERDGAADAVGRRERLPEAQRPELAAREEVEVQCGRDDDEEEREDLRGE